MQKNLCLSNKNMIETKKKKENYNSGKNVQEFNNKG